MSLPPTKIRRQYKCKNCPTTTTNPREHLYHRREKHQEKVKIVECDLCMYACQYVQKLTRHMLLVHKIKKPSSTGSTTSSSTNHDGHHNAIPAQHQQHHHHQQQQQQQHQHQQQLQQHQRQYQQQLYQQHRRIVQHPVAGHTSISGGALGNLGGAGDPLKLLQEIFMIENHFAAVAASNVNSGSEPLDLSMKRI